MPLHRRSVLLSSTLALSGAAHARAAGVPAGTGWARDDAGAAVLQQAMSAGRVTSRQVVRDCLARIAALDRRGPSLRSVLELNPQALQVAAERDAERRAGRLRGALHGVPVLLKDNIATAGDGMSTTAGSLALAGVQAVRDAHLVARLREAGAVILGKNNLSEWANIRSTRSTSGWSALGGLAKNPYALDRNTSGSSSGTAAAVAAALAPLGVGTETDGSIVSPASICGLVGLKPTVGRISRDGVIPISHTQDSAGPMARTVADCALLFAALCGADEADAATAAAPAPGGSLQPDALKGARLGIAKAYFTGFDEADALFGRCVAQLRALGADVIDDAGLAAAAYWEEEIRVLLYELKHNLPLWLQRFAPQAGVKTLADVIAFNKAHAAQEMGWFGQELFERAQALGTLDDAAYRDARAACVKAARNDGLDAAFARHRLDALIAPTGGLAWLSDPINGDHYGSSFSTPAAVAGYPHLTVPAGLVRGLPLGLSFVGPAFSEWRLLSFGAAFERHAHARVAPGYARVSVPA